MQLLIHILIGFGCLCVGLYAWNQAFPSTPTTSPERLRQLQADADVIKQSQDALKTLDTNPNARVYSYDEIKHRIGLDGLKCKVHVKNRAGEVGAYHYGTIGGGYVNCGYWGVPLEHCSDYVFLD